MFVCVCVCGWSASSLLTKGRRFCLRLSEFAIILRTTWVWGFLLLLLRTISVFCAKKLTWKKWDCHYTNEISTSNVFRTRLWSKLNEEKVTVNVTHNVNSVQEQCKWTFIIALCHSAVLENYFLRDLEKWSFNKFGSRVRCSQFDGLMLIKFPSESWGHYVIISIVYSSIILSEYYSLINNYLEWISLGFPVGLYIYNQCRFDDWRHRTLYSLKKTLPVTVTVTVETSLIGNPIEIH